MNRVTPKICNGDLQLIVSETLCCNPKLGVQIYLPVTVDRSIKIEFVFNENGDKSKKDFTPQLEGDVIKFYFTNFLVHMGASLSQPFEFKIGKDTFLMQIYGFSSGDHCLCLTISIFYKEGNG